MTPEAILEIQQLRDNFYYVEDMADCAEKYLIQLHLDHQIYIKSDGEARYFHGEDPKVQATEAMKNFMQSIEQENLGHYASITQFMELRGKKQNQPGAIADALLNILQEIQPLNVKLMLKLIATTQQQKIESEVITPFFGRSRVGKSTTLHYFAGADMSPTKTDDAYEHIAYKHEQSNKQLENVVTSPYQLSVTRAPFTYSINHKDNAIDVCDTPGFEDTAGPERDLVNGISLVNLLKMHKSKPIIFISRANMEESCNGLVDLIQTIARLMPNLDEVQLSSLSYVFTKFEKAESTKIVNKLKHLQSDARIKNTNEKSLLADMLQKAKANIFILDFKEEKLSLNQQRDAFLDKLIATKPIENPKDTFSHFSSENSKDKLKLQLEQQQYSIERAMRQGDVKLLKDKQKELEALNSCLGEYLPNVKAAYQQSTRIVNEYIDKLIKEMQLVQNIILTDEFSLKNKDLPAQCNQKIQTLIQFDESLKTACLEPVIKKQKELIEKIKQDGQKIETIVNLQKKIEFLSNQFATPNESSQAVKSVFEKLINQAKQAVDDKDLTQYLDLIKKADDVACDLTGDDIQAAFDDARTYCTQHITQAVNQALDALQTSNLTDNTHQQVNASIDLLNSVLNTPAEIYDYMTDVTQQDVNEYKESILINVSNYFVRLEEEINNQLLGDAKTLLKHVSNVEKLLTQIVVMREKSEISEDTNVIYEKQEANIIAIIDKLKAQVYVLWNNLKTYKRDDHYNQLGDTLSAIDRIEHQLIPLLKQKSEAFDQLIKKIVIDIEQIECGQKNGPFLALIEINKVTEYCQPAKPELTKLQKDITDAFEKEIAQAMTSAQQHFSNNNLIDINVQGEISTAFDKLKTLVDENQKDLSFENRHALILKYSEALQSFRVKLLTYSRQITNSNLFESLPTLKFYWQVATCFLGVDKFFSINDQFIATVHAINHIKYHQENILTTILNNYKDTDGFYHKVGNLHNYRIYRKQSLQYALPLLDSASQNYDQDIKLSFVQINNHPTAELFEKINKLCERLKDDHFKNEAEKIGIFIQSELNHFVGQLRLCEPVVARKHMATVQGLITKLPQDMANAIELKLKALDLEITQIEQKDAQALAAQKNLDQLIPFMLSNYTIFKFDLAAKAKNELDGIFLDKFNHFNMIGKFQAPDPHAEVLKALRLIYKDYVHYRAHLRECNGNYRNERDWFSSYNPNSFSENLITVQFKNLIDQANEPWSKMLDNLNKLNITNDIKTLNDDYKLFKLLAMTHKENPGLYDNMFENHPKLSKNSLNQDFAGLKAYYVAKQKRFDVLLTTKQVTPELSNIMSDLKKADSVLLDAKKLNFDDLSDVRTYSQLQDAYIAANKQWKKEMAEPLKDNKHLVVEASKSREMYFKNLFANYLALENVSFMMDHVNNQNTKEIHEAARDGLTALGKNIHDLVTSIKSSFSGLTKLSTVEQKKIYFQYDTLRHCKDNFESPVLKQTIEFVLQDLDSLAAKELDALEKDQLVALEKLKAGNQLIPFAQLLADYILKLKAMSTNFPALEIKMGDKIITRFDAKIDEVLAKYEKEYAAVIPVLSKNVITWAGPQRRTYARRLIDEHDALQGQAMFLRNAQTNKVTPAIVLAQLQGTEVEKVELERQFNDFYKQYWELVNAGLAKDNPQALSDLVTDTKLIPGNSQVYKDKIRNLLVHLFAYWTLESTAASYKKMLKASATQKKDGCDLLFRSDLPMDHPTRPCYVYLQNHNGKALYHFNDNKYELVAIPDLNSFNEKLNVLAPNKDDGSLSLSADEVHHLITSEEYKNFLMSPHCAQVFGILRLFGMDVKDPGVMDFLFSGKGKSLGDYLSTTWQAILTTFTGKVTAAASIVGLGSVVPTALQEQGDPLYQLHNHFAQILTGEGKSVTLAMMAAVFGLMKHPVHCACYSEYLSLRDYEAFAPLFDAFGLKGIIKYGTFNDLSKSLLKEKLDIEKSINAIMRGKSVELIPAQINQKRAQLLLDEVDSFFTKDFYGNCYEQTSVVHDPAVTALIKMMWARRNSSNFKDIKSIKSTLEYQRCVPVFPDWEALIFEAVKSMYIAITTLPEHQYHIDQDGPRKGQINYIEQDGVDYDQVYGYSTLYAYYQEHDKNPTLVPQAKLDEKSGLYIRSGRFSYAEMLRENYLHIRGVTGTLQNFSPAKKKILLNEYKVKKNTFVPSAYGDKKMRYTFKPELDVELVNDYHDDDHFEAIAREIRKRLNLKGKDKGAVLAFFKDETALLKFYNSPVYLSAEFSDLRDRTATLTQTSAKDPLTRDALVSAAATTGRITLAPMPYSRGVDYVCYDDELNQNGGLHVIATTVPPTVEDQTQLEGRTARQGGWGSCSWVISKGELATIYNINPSYSITAYNEIVNARHKLCEEQFARELAQAANIVKDHEEAKAFVDALASNDKIKVKEFLLNQNREVILQNEAAPTVIMIDATGSMAGLLQDTKDTVEEMFKEAYDELASHPQYANAKFTVQIMIYRNYNARKVYEDSGAQAEPLNLKSFLNDVKASGGLGNEAMEVTFYNLNKQLDEALILGKVLPRQVVVMGDMPPQSREDAKRNSDIHGSYWGNKEVYFDNELNKFLKYNIPVNTFYLDSSAERSFKDIARKTGGTSASLNVRDKVHAKETLKTTVTAQILDSIGDGLKISYLAKKAAKSHLASSSGSNHMIINSAVYNGNNNNNTDTSTSNLTTQYNI